MHKKMKKINLQEGYKNLLALSGIITIAIGIINQLIKVFEEYAKKAVEYTSRMSEAVAMSPQQINSIQSFFNNNWQLMLIGLGVLIVLFVIIFVEKHHNN